MTSVAEPAAPVAADRLTSLDLVGLVERTGRMAGVAGRADLADRLATSRGALATRRIRVVVVGASGQGVTSLVGALEQTGSQWLPGASFGEVPGHPGSGQPGSGQPRLPEPGSADVVLFVAGADHEYTAVELDAIGRLRADGAAVVGVITKIDVNRQWAEVQQADRRRLGAANLDAPPIPLLPVSAGLLHAGRQRGDEGMVTASGVPQLLDFLRDRLGTPVEAAVRDSVLAEVRAVADQLTRAWDAELRSLDGVSPRQRQERAVAELDRRQQLSAAWQIALGDGATELVAQVDFDLRERLRGVLERAEAEIKDSSPTGHWSDFDVRVRGDVEQAVRANHALADARSHGLAEQVGGALTGNRDGSARGLPRPPLRLNPPDEALRRIKPMPPPEGGGMFARVVNSVRGSYGGILMVGVLTSLAGLQLISVWSVGAGLALGLFTFWEDRKNARDRGRAEATVAVSKLMDEVNFRVGDELRTQLRGVHRVLRDHFTVINDRLLRAASDAVRTAAEAAPVDDRRAELQNHLAELRQIRVRITPGR
jgi:hypothetical protein